MFIRAKKIKGVEYGYKVKNSWTSKGSRQKSTKYLGKIVVLIKNETTAQQKPILQDLDFKTAVKDIIKLELLNHGFKEKKDKLEIADKDLIVDFQKVKVTHSKRPALIKINDGYFCDETLKKLLEYTPSAEKHEEQIGLELAELFINAGIKIDHEVFVEVFEKVFEVN